MPEKLTFNRELGIIEVVSFGKVTREDSIASVAALAKLMEETGTHRVLADTSCQEATPNTFDIFKFGNELPAPLKLAFIVVTKQPTAADVSFVSNVASNRGIETRIFGTRAEALKWLLA